MQKLIAIVGPTASGKTAFSIDVAKVVNGEIINGDSRQIYDGFPATTAKPSEEELAAVPHHLIGTHPIGRSISVTEYRALAEAAIADISARGKMPIIVGGTGHWIDAVLYNQTFPEVEPNGELREALMERPAEELYAVIESKDPRRAKELDPSNKKRLVRALEIIEELGSVPEAEKQTLAYDAVIYGISWSDEELRKRIEDRTDLFLEQMLKEAEEGLATLSDERAKELGFDFSIPRSYLRSEFSREEFLVRLKAARWQYSRRQMRWFKRNKDIKWITAIEFSEVLKNPENR